MAFKMKGSPYGEKRGGELDMKPRVSENFGKSGMKNADGSNVKPGAPGFFGNLIKGKGVVGGLLNPMGAIMSRMKKKKAAATPEPQPAAAAAVPPQTTGPAPVPTDEQAGPVVDPNAQVDPNAAPMQKRIDTDPKKKVKSGDGVAKKGMMRKNMKPINRNRPKPGELTDEQKIKKSDALRKKREMDALKPYTGKRSKGGLKDLTDKERGKKNPYIKKY